jgi:hypothetical protein
MNIIANNIFCISTQKILFAMMFTGVHSALVRVNEELLERKVAAPV